jgi:PAS domain S-box-containing protein
MQTSERMKAANALLQAISTLQSRFIGHVPMGTLFKETIESILTLTGSEYGFIGEAFLTPDRIPYFKIQALSDSVWHNVSRDFYARHAPIGLEFYNLDNLFGTVLKTGQPVVIDDIDQLAEYGRLLPEGHPPIHSFLALPIANGNEPLGLVGIANRHGGYDPQLVAWLQPLLATCAALIAANRAHQWRVDAESELRRQALVFDNISDAVLLTDRDGIILDCNPAALTMLDCPRKKLLGTPLGFLLDAAEEQPESSAVRHAIDVAEASGRWNGSLAVRLGEQGPGLWEMAVVPLQDPVAGDGTLVWFCQDVTERHALQMKLKERARELNAIADLSPDGFVFVGQDSQISYVNPAFEKMTGLRADELAGISHAELGQTITSLCDATANVDLPSGAGEVLLRLARPHFTILKRTERSLQDEAGQVQGTVQYYRDVTREAEVDRMKSEFLSTAAHELRTPMASVLGFAELLITRDYPPEKQRHFLEVIHRQSGQLVGLLNELLDLARIEARAGQDFHIAAHALAPIVEEVVAKFYLPGDERLVQLSLPKHSPPVLVDPDKLQLALTNVLSNAYKYSRGEGSISLEVSRRDHGNGQQLGIVVRDQGIGMTPPQLARIFERFYRADDSGKIAGTGLGMSLVKEIIDIFQGTVEIASTPGAGTEVALWLPCAPAACKGKNKHE